MPKFSIQTPKKWISVWKLLILGLVNFYYRILNKRWNYFACIWKHARIYRGIGKIKDMIKADKNVWLMTLPVIASEDARKKKDYDFLASFVFIYGFLTNMLYLKIENIY